VKSKKRRYRSALEREEGEVCGRGSKEMAARGRMRRESDD
jgi:hypothetical protein